MRLYIWYDVENLTSNYHSWGGLVITTNLKPEEAFKKAIEDGHVDSSAVYKEPDKSYKVQSAENEVFVFPDAGCC